MKHIVIIGNGISGVTAARHIRKRSSDKITIISSETQHFYSRTALMYIYMGHMKYENTKPYEDFFWKKNRIDLLFDHVTNVDTDARRVLLKTGSHVQYDVLIIASGSKSNRFNWPGADYAGVQTLYGYPDVQAMEKLTVGISEAVVVGGGLIGVEMAEMLQSRGIKVTFLIREPAFWSIVLPLQDARLITEHIRSHGVNVVLNTELKSINGTPGGRVQSIATNTGETIACQFVGLAVGVSPNIDFLEKSGIATNKGVLVDEYLQTNIPDVYAIGDCVERNYALPGRNNIEQVWYTGRMMGEAVAQTVCGIQTQYKPGPWFNSAKFFDIEYQTYGTVGNVFKEDEADFYWQHEDGKKAVHIIWNKRSLEFSGVNAFGIRMRHEFFDNCLRSRKDVRYVVGNLREANFDPEFYRRYEGEIVQAFYNQYPAIKAA